MNQGIPRASQPVILSRTKKFKTILPGINADLREK
jgi:hypothetical protein